MVFFFEEEKKISNHFPVAHLDCCETARGHKSGDERKSFFKWRKVFLRESARGENSRIKLRTCSPTHVVESFFDMGKHTNKMIQIPNLVLFKKYLLLPKSFSSW